MDYTFTFYRGSGPISLGRFRPRSEFSAILQVLTKLDGVY